MTCALVLQLPLAGLLCTYDWFCCQTPTFFLFNSQIMDKRFVFVLGWLILHGTPPSPFTVKNKTSPTYDFLEGAHSRRNATAVPRTYGDWTFLSHSEPVQGLDGRYGVLHRGPGFVDKLLPLFNTNSPLCLANPLDFDKRGTCHKKGWGVLS